MEVVEELDFCQIALETGHQEGKGYGVLKCHSPFYQMLKQLLRYGFMEQLALQCRPRHEN